MAVVGGTTSAIAGGKFANGAVTGAFVHMFNDEMDPRLNRAMGTDADRIKSHRIVANGFEKIADVSGAISVYGMATKNLVLTFWSGVVSTAATTMKFMISPDSHTSQEIVNDYLPPQYQSTELH
ncbi:hypothetical protein [Sulfurimonas sp.]|uniref:hypothetical protein n=1 Tax=Sulfurimonas sp. TaxID=2022749 RepID=UPI003563CE98